MAWIDTIRLIIVVHVYENDEEKVVRLLHVKVQPNRLQWALETLYGLYIVSRV